MGNTSVQAQPLNDDFQDAIFLTGGEVVTFGSNVNATFQTFEDEPSHDPGRGASVWWRWTSLGDGIVTISTAGSDFDTVLDVFDDGSFSEMDLLATNDDGPEDFTSEVRLPIRMGERISIAVDSYGLTAEGNIVLSVTFQAVSAPHNDHISDAEVIFGFPATVEGSNFLAGLDPGETVFEPNAEGSTVWWKWTSSRTGRVLVTLLGSDFDTILAVYRGTVPGQWTLLGVNDDFDEYTSALKFQAVAGETYYFGVDGYAGSAGAVRLSLADASPKQVPNWQIFDLNGQSHSSATLQGKVYILNFWATWCQPCIVEIPDLIRLYEQYKSDGLVVLGPSVDEDGLSVVIPFVSDHAMTYPVGLAPGGMSSAFGGVSAIPASFVVDRNGQVHEELVGTRTFAEFEAAILPLLYPPPTLQISLGQKNAVLSWPETSPGFQVWGSSNLRDWSSINGVPQMENGQWTLRVSLIGGTSYFRLQR